MDHPTTRPAPVRRPQRHTSRAARFGRIVALFLAATSGAPPGASAEPSRRPITHPPLLQPPTRHPAQQADKEEPARGMATAGAIVTILGAMSGGLSIIGYVQAANVCDGGCHDVQGLGAVPWTIAAVAGTAGGVIAMSIGIPLWVVGVNDEEPTAEHGAPSVPPAPSLHLSGGPGSAALLVRF